MPIFTNTHRHFVQFMLSNGVVKISDAVAFLERVNPDYSSPALLQTLIIEINREISKQSYKIVTSICEITSENIYVWVTTKDDEISKDQRGFSPVELEYFNVILQEIVGTEDRCLPYPRVINISSTLTGSLSRENGEKAVNKWVRVGYFVKQKGEVFLGPRTILEFSSYLKSALEDSTCNLCSEIVVVGDTCPSCNNTFHKSCLKKYLQRQGCCPNCKAQWDLDESSSASEPD